MVELVRGRAATKCCRIAAAAAAAAAAGPSPGDAAAPFVKGVPGTPWTGTGWGQRTNPLHRMGMSTVMLWKTGRDTPSHDAVCGAR